MRFHKNTNIAIPMKPNRQIFDPSAFSKQEEVYVIVVDNSIQMPEV